MAFFFVRNNKPDSFSTLATQDRQASLASLPLPETNKDEEAARRRAISEAGPRPTIKPTNEQPPPLPSTDNSAKPVQKQDKTECNCIKAGEHYPKVVLDQTFNCSIETLYNLLYEGDFLKKFLLDQKNTGMRKLKLTTSLVLSDLAT